MIFFAVAVLAGCSPSNDEESSSTDVEPQPAPITEVASAVPVAGGGLAATFREPALAVRRIVVSTGNATGEVAVAVSEVDLAVIESAPDVSGQVFQMLEISLEAPQGDGPAELESVTVTFEVLGQWLIDAGADVGDVVLQRLVGQNWTSLETRSLGASGSSEVYEAVSPGLSLFAVTVDVPRFSTTPVPDLASTVTGGSTPTPGSAEVSLSNGEPQTEIERTPMVPTPSPTATAVLSQTRPSTSISPTATGVAVSTPSPTASPTTSPGSPTPFPTPETDLGSFSVISPTATPRPTATPTAVPFVERPIVLPTATPTRSPNTPVVPTATEVPPTLVDTPVVPPPDTPTPTNTPAPTATPLPGDPRFGVTMHTGVKTEVEYFLTELGVPWYSTNEENASNVPQGARALVLLNLTQASVNWSAERAGSINDISDELREAWGFHSTTQIASLVASNPGGAWLVLAEPNRPLVKTPTAAAAVYHYYYTTIKATDPTATVLTPAILNWRWTCARWCTYTTGESWLGDFIAAYHASYQSIPPTDGIAINVYPIDWENLPNASPVKPPFDVVKGQVSTHWEIAVSQVEDLRTYLDGIGYSDTPIWITETAIHWGYDDRIGLTPDGSYNPDLMAGYLRNVVDWLEANSASKQIERWFYYVSYRQLGITHVDGFAGITFFKGPDVGDERNCIGDTYLALSLDQARRTCNSAGDTVFE